MKVTKLCQSKYNIDHCTLQIEDGREENKHQFECEQTTHKNLDIEGIVKRSSEKKLEEGH